MKRVKDGMVELTGGEQIVLIVAASHRGLRDMSKRTGKFSREKEPNLNRTFVWGASRLLNVFGDWKMTGEDITDLCTQVSAMRGIKEG